MVRPLVFATLLSLTLPGAALASPVGEAVPLAFSDILVGSPRELRPSPRLHALAGHRVRLKGFMVKMELPPRGAFWLAPRPVECDEAGAGTADLPPESVRVVLRSADGKAVAFIPRPLEVVGLLEVGARVEDDGSVSHLRILLDPPAETSAERTGTSTQQPHRPAPETHDAR